MSEIRSSTTSRCGVSTETKPLDSEAPTTMMVTHPSFSSTKDEPSSTSADRLHTTEFAETTSASMTKAGLSTVATAGGERLHGDGLGILPSQTPRNLHSFDRRAADRYPFAQFIMAVNQWRHIDDPVDELKLEIFESENGWKVDEIRNHHQTGWSVDKSRKGDFGWVVPQTPTDPFFSDGKSTKGLYTWPMGISEQMYCYRQLIESPIPKCPIGFELNKQGGCFKYTEPAESCIAVRQILLLSNVTEIFPHDLLASTIYCIFVNHATK